MTQGNYNQIKNIQDQIIKLVNKFVELNYKKPEFIPGVSEIPVSGKIIGQNETKNMVEAVLDGWLTTGRFNDEFEKKLSKYLNIKSLITVN